MIKIFLLILCVGLSIAPSVARNRTESHATSERRGRAGEAESGAHLLINNSSHNFGEVSRKGGDLVHDFLFTNDGTTPLVITRVITTCSCIKASFPRKPIAPGDKGAIRITYQPLKSEPGTFSKVIQVYSNSIDGKDVLTVQGQSVEGVEMKIKGDKIKLKTK